MVNRLVALLLVLALAVVAARACWSTSGCPVAKAFGRPCVACGVTRDVCLLFRGHRPVHNPCSLLYAIWFPAEVGFRLVGGFLRHFRTFAVVDILSHALLAVAWAVLIVPFCLGA